MRALYGLVALIALAVGAIWIGGENWAAARLREMIAQRPDIRAEAVSPLRRPARIGLHLARPEWDAPAGTIGLDWLELWVSPLKPWQGVASLPPRGLLSLPGRQAALELEESEARLSLTLPDGKALSHAGLRSDGAAVEGRVLLDGIRFSADLATPGADAPQGAGAAYDLDLTLAGFQGDALVPLGVAPLALPGALSARGSARIWLDQPVAPGDRQPPRLAGLRMPGLELRLGDMTARLVGRLASDAQGRPEGRLALYTPDGQDFLEAAIAAGLLPEDGRMLIRAMLLGAGGMEMPDPATPDGLDFPAAGPGELRIPLSFRDGQVFLGVMPIGPAPRWPG